MSGEHPRIFDFVDFRQYLQESYKSRSKGDRHFSHRYISGKLGDKSPSYFQKILSGRRRCTTEQIEVLIKVFEMDREEARYFQSMIHYDAAKDNAEREYHLGLMAAIATPSRRESNADPSDYYSEWYHAAIHGIIAILDLKEDDIPMIAKKLRPALSVQEVRNSIQLLERLNLIQRNRKGIWKQKDVTQFSNQSIQDATIKTYRVKCLDLARHAITSPRSNPPSQFLNSTFAISTECFESLIQCIKQDHSKWEQIIQKDNRPKQHLIQLQHMLFPLSEG